MSIINSNFLSRYFLSIYTLSSSYWHLWSLQIYAVLPLPFLLVCLDWFHLHLPWPISSRGRFWPKPDVSASSFESHKIPYLYLFWHLPPWALYYWGLDICISSPFSSLGVLRGILSYPQCLAQSLAHNTYWDEMSRSTLWVKESPFLNDKISRLWINEDFCALLFFPSSRQSIHRELSLLCPSYTFLRIPFLKAKHLSLTNGINYYLS